MKCPSCGATVAHLNATATTSPMGAAQLRTVIFSCPMVGCFAIISAQVDPISIKTDTINGVIAELQKRGVVP